MNVKETRLKQTFEYLAKKGEKALVAFITAGDPDMNSTRNFISAIEKGGADIIELGIPFSDPMADGPTIQASSERALKNGATLDKVFTLVENTRKTSNIPIVLFGYYNPVFVYGVKRFAKRASEAGCDGVLIVDLPPEESGELKKELDAVGIPLIYLLTPTSGEDRMRIVAKGASGFIYYVSVAGVTGARRSLSNKIAKSVKKIRKFTDVPIGVGFGISTPEQAREVAAFSDAVIVGSAIINVISSAKDSVTAAAKVEEFVRGLKQALK
ncbi:MAG: tryptophan synthase subunit alpha [Thermodesulfobacteriota bacterium]